MTRIRMTIAGFIAATGLSVAALSGYSASEAAQTPPEMAGAEVYVQLKDFAITPRHPVVTANQAVRFMISNEGPRNHAITIKGQGMEVTSQQIATGENTVLAATFATPGTYFVWCPVGSHRDQGMVSTITVVAEMEPPALAQRVDLDEWSIRPFAATVVAGQANKIELRNVGRFPHDLVIEGMRTRVASERLATGESIIWETTLMAPGTYEIYCSVVAGTNSHRELGMTGILEVLPNAPVMVQMMNSGT